MPVVIKARQVAEALHHSLAVVAVAVVLLVVVAEAIEIVC